MPNTSTEAASTPPPDEREVEAVARAIYSDAPSQASEWSEELEHARESYRAEARRATAALDARREGRQGRSLLRIGSSRSQAQQHRREPSVGLAEPPVAR